MMHEELGLSGGTGGPCFNVPDAASQQWSMRWPALSAARKAPTKEKPDTSENEHYTQVVISKLIGIVRSIADLVATDGVVVLTSEKLIPPIDPWSPAAPND
ncbi:hypothetical protein ACLOJK_032157 [Asimina triloba]